MVTTALFFGIVTKGLNSCEAVYLQLPTQDLPPSIFTAMYERMLLHQIEPNSNPTEQKRIVAEIVTTVVGLENAREFSYQVASSSKVLTIYSEGHNWLVAFLEWIRPHHKDDTVFQLLDAIKFEVALLYDIGKKYPKALDVVNLHKIALELTTHFQAHQG